MKIKRRKRKIMVHEFCAKLGVSILDAESRLSEIRPNDGKYFNEDGIRSGYVMPLYFSVVSLIIKNAVSILEIGTGNGLITNLLAHLYPTATVYTIDIPASDKDYEQFSWRAHSEENMKQFKKNITNRDNIKYIERNSFFLPSMRLPQEFDLVFVDGGHKNPVVAWDTMFVYNHLRPGGFVFFHDYGDQQPDVPLTLDYIEDIIDEEIQIIPHTMTVGRVAWIRKLSGDKNG